MRTTTALLASAAAIGFMSETCEVVLAKGKNGPVRVNKSDFDADQNKPAGEREYSAYSGKEEAEQSIPGAERTDFESLEGVDTTAAPSAPNFNHGAEGTKPPIDPEKNAVAPATTSPNQRLVMKEGNKFFIVDSMGVKLTSEVARGEIDEKGYPSKVAAEAAIAKLPR